MIQNSLHKKLSYAAGYAVGLTRRIGKSKKREVDAVVKRRAVDYLSEAYQKGAATKAVNDAIQAGKASYDSIVKEALRMLASKNPDFGGQWSSKSILTEARKAKKRGLSFDDTLQLFRSAGVSVDEFVRYWVGRAYGKKTTAKKNPVKRNGMSKAEARRLLGASLYRRIFLDPKREPLTVLALIRQNEPDVWFGKHNRTLAHIERKLFAGDIQNGRKVNSLKRNTSFYDNDAKFFAYVPVNSLLMMVASAKTKSETLARAKRAVVPSAYKSITVKSRKLTGEERRVAKRNAPLSASEKRFPVRVTGHRRELPASEHLRARRAGQKDLFSGMSWARNSEYGISRVKAFTKLYSKDSKGKFIDYEDDVNTPNGKGYVFSFNLNGVRVVLNDGRVADFKPSQITVIKSNPSNVNKLSAINTAKKLHIKTANGWEMVFAYNGGKIVTTKDARKALPQKAMWAQDDLKFFRNKFANDEFSLRIPEKSNPSNVNKLSAMFQGKASGATRSVPVSDYAPKGTLPRLGRLDNLVVKTQNGRQTIHFKNSLAMFTDTPSFKGSSKGWQIVIGGRGAKFSPDSLRKLNGGKSVNNPAKGEFLDAGEIQQITYVSNKTHIDPRTVHYYHNLGEETGVKPRLYIDYEGMPLIIGGAYRITEAGIEN